MYKETPLLKGLGAPIYNVGGGIAGFNTPFIVGVLELESNFKDPMENKGASPLAIYSAYATKGIDAFWGTCEVIKRGVVFT